MKATSNKQTVIILFEECEYGYSVAQVAFSTIPVDDFGLSYGLFQITELDLDQIEDDTFFVKFEDRADGTIHPIVCYDEDGSENMYSFVITNERKITHVTQE
jgi:hypothetical protein